MADGYGPWQWTINHAMSQQPSAIDGAAAISH
jgi:hypothetical protein